MKTKIVIYSVLSPEYTWVDQHRSWVGRLTLQTSSDEVLVDAASCPPNQSQGPQHCKTRYQLQESVYYQCLKDFEYGILTKSIMKKIAAQKKAAGSERTSSGYVRKTRPGPDLTTLAMGRSLMWAMWPRMENTRTPAVRQVQVLTTQVIRASR